MSHRSLVLFEEVAKATISRFKGGALNAQESAIRVNAFGKMAYLSLVLFEEVAKAAFPEMKPIGQGSECFGKMAHCRLVFFLRMQRRQSSLPSRVSKMSFA